MEHILVWVNYNNDLFNLFFESREELEATIKELVRFDYKYQVFNVSKCISYEDYT